MRSTRDVLVATKALIDAPEKWIKGELKSFQGGKPCFCIYGAIGEAAITAEEDESVVRALRKAAPYRYLSVFNDAVTTTHADVMALFDRAIAAQDDQP